MAQVPSWPLEDDQYEVVIVRYASRQTRRSEVYLNYHLYGEPDGPIGMDYYFWILRNAHRTIVIDTGYSESGGRNRQRGHLIHPAEALDLLGIDRDRCDVVLTHAHYDHAGNLDLFPSSSILIPRSEFDFWTSPLGQRRMYHHSIEDADIDRLREAHAEGRVRLAESAELSVAPGVRMIELGGHSPGQAILLVSTPQGPVLLASDATHYYEELERDMPFLVVDNLAAMYRGFDVMKDLAAQHDAIIIPGHDPDVLARHSSLTGPLAGVAAVIGAQPRNEGAR